MFRNDNKRTPSKPSAGGTQNRQPPDFIGSVVAQRLTLDAIIKHFGASGLQEIVCNIAGWDFGTGKTACLHLEISRPRKTTVPSKLKDRATKRRGARYRV
jgi:hypothetical protein